MYYKFLSSAILFPVILIVVSSSSIFQNPPEKDLIVHEWGTFTTLHGSDGSQLSGLYIEEEQLPDFVYMHKLPYNINNRFRRHKGQFIEPLNVTVKMETPVIYFYSKTSKEVSVDIGFPKGAISQWYPQSSGVDAFPKEDEIDFAKPFNGLISWNNVQVLAPDAKDKFSSPKEQETATWISPRETDANKIMVKDEVEKFLFYRGIGNFAIPLEFNFNENKELKIKNNGNTDIPYVFVYESAENGPNVWWTGSLGQKETVKVKSTKSSIAYVDAKLKEFQKALIKEGLYEKEAIAMLKTWENSYFKKSGFRVFYILPPEEVEALLPINIIPTPEAMKRVFVGRCDIFTPAFEQQLMVDYKVDVSLNKYRDHRYYLGMTQRANNINSN